MSCSQRERCQGAHTNRQERASPIARAGLMKSRMSKIIVNVVKVVGSRFGGAHEIIVNTQSGLVQSGKVNLVPKDASNTTESLAELGSFLTLVGDKFQSGTKLLVVVGKPFQQGDLLHNFQLNSGGFVTEERLVFLLFFGQMKDLGFIGSRILDFVSADIQIFPHDQSLDSTHFQSSQGVTNTVAILASVLGNFIKVLGDQLLLLNKFDVGENFSRELNGLIETIFTTIRNIHNLDNLFFDSWI
mmetsp:Transcript_4616/g.6445  ORF Transcript_4616/g.6445 Transcript_4616/m.6445 type:complete len:244 (+) Transcript_4616:88-819(+)